MECSVCWGDLLDDPQTGPAPPPTKKKKVDKTKPTSSSDHCCLPCGHVFHRQCIITWFGRQNPQMKSGQKKGTCPVCRKKSIEKQVYPFYFTTSEDKSTPKSGSGTGESSSSTTLSSLASKFALFPTTPKTAPSSSPGGNSTASQTRGLCQNEDCQDLQMRFKLLQKDFEEVNAKLKKAQEKADDKQAGNKSRNGHNRDTQGKTNSSRGRGRQDFLNYLDSDSEFDSDDEYDMDDDNDDDEYW